MLSATVHFAIEAVFISGILYAITWAIFGTIAGGRPSLRRLVHVTAVLAVAAVAGIARTLVAVVWGGATMDALWTNKGTGLIGPVLIPLVLSGLAVVFIRNEAHRFPRSQPSPEPRSNER